MSSAKRETNLATAGLAAAAVLVFGATAAFAAASGSGNPAAKSRTTGQYAHDSAAYGGAPVAGSESAAGAGIGVGAGGKPGSLPDGAVFGQGPHGDETVKDAAGQWVEEIWQTGKVDTVGADQVKVTDVTGLAWQWTVSPTARVLINGTDGQVGEIQAGDTVTLSGTESDEVHTATAVTDPGHPRG